MKKILFIISVSLAITSSNLHAKESTFFNVFGNAISIAADGATLINEVNKYNSRNNSRTRIVYKDKIIYKEVNTPSNEEINLKTKLATKTRQLAWEKAKDKKHKKAIRLYKESLEYEANNWKIWHGYGWSFSELGMLVEAENAFKTAINLGAKDETWRYLGWNFERQGKTENAKICYKNSLSINHKNKKSRYALKNINNTGNKKYSGQWYTVTAKPSLTVRSEPTLKGRNKIGSLPNNSKIKLIKFVGKNQSIGGRNGRWAYVEYKNTKGYVFGAHLTK